MDLKHFASCVLTLLCFTIIATPAMAASGFYTGVSLGGYDLEFDDFKHDRSGMQFGATGGYEFSDFFAIEAEYQRLVEINDRCDDYYDDAHEHYHLCHDNNYYDDHDDRYDTDVDLDVLSIAIRPRIPITDRVNIFGKLGYGRYKLRGQRNREGVNITTTEYDNAPIYGLGVAVNFSRFSVRAEVTNIDVDDVDLYVGSVSASYHFGR